MASYCPHCMRPAQGERCPHCGKSLHWTNGAHLLPVGTVIDTGQQRYQFGAVRGQGGFGITYIGLQFPSLTRVAIKEYFPTRCAQRAGDHRTVCPSLNGEALFQGGRNSFLMEAQMLAKVGRLPGIVEVLDFFEANHTAYLVMEFLDGVPLHKVVADRGSIPAQELLPMLPPLLDSLGQLHQQGILHRDISPDNLMWMPDNSLKLLDFGCARSMEDGRSMTVMLKHGFAPVEQYQTRGQGPWTDVYALCATLYYCLTGVIPPMAVDRLEEDTLQPPNALGAGLTPEQEEVLLWGLTVQPKTRAVNMEVFAQRFFPSAPESEPESESDPLPPTPQPIRARLGPILVKVLLAVLVVLAALLLLLVSSHALETPIALTHTLGRVHAPWFDSFSVWR